MRYVWNAEEEEWYFSVIDVVEVLSGSQNPRRYWSDLKIKLVKEGSEVYDKIVQLKLQAADGKMRETDVLSTKNVLRLIQSIPSPKAEPFKMWLAQVGNDRLERKRQTFSGNSK
ncbi:MAG: Bro-N domain-containing protein [Treponema sp.]|nr:Bro-N domain-containing protein [Treponema sp.]